MKKLLIAAFAFCLASAAFAEDAAIVAKAPAQAQPAAQSCQEDWDFLSVAFYPDVPPTANEVNVRGVKLGLPTSFGERSKVVGTELSLFASTTKQVKGFQAALLYCVADKVVGLQANPIVNVAKSVEGVQMGLINCSEGSSFQFGLVNYIKDSPVPFMILVNCKF